jgi:hypothetical protein
VPHMPKRLHSVRPQAPATQLAPSDIVPPDLIDVDDDLPITPDAPNPNKPSVGRNPVVRKLSRFAPALDSVSMKNYGPSADAASAGLF